MHFYTIPICNKSVTCLRALRSPSSSGRRETDLFLLLNASVRLFESKKKPVSPPQEPAFLFFVFHNLGVASCSKQPIPRNSWPCIGGRVQTTPLLQQEKPLEIFPIPLLRLPEKSLTTLSAKGSFGTPSGILTTRVQRDSNNLPTTFSALAATSAAP